MKLTMVDESSISKKSNRDINQYKIKKFNEARLKMLYAPLPDDPKPHLQHTLSFSRSKNGFEHNAIMHLSSLSTEARTYLLGEMYALYTRTMQNNLEALEAMSG